MTVDTFIGDVCRLLDEEIERLSFLAEHLKKAKSLEEKIDLLNQDPRVVGEEIPFCLRLEDELIVKSIFAIGQGKRVFSSEDLSSEDREKRMQLLMDLLHPIEKFYSVIGGIVGYHLTMLQFLCRPERRFEASEVKYHSPHGKDLSQPSLQREAVYWAVEKMEETCEIYPVGGAADRLRLCDLKTGSPLPAAKLVFQGKTLMDRLMEDLQAREYLYYKCKGKQIEIPVAMMTSAEKNNHEHILDLFDKRHWYFRKKERFSFFCQPLVPTMNRKGLWGMTGPMQLLLKPGGHGVIWKLAQDQGVFSWFFQQGVRKAIVRQINNPISFEDGGLLAFYGCGLMEDKEFGFASCVRQVKASEGTNVIVEKKTDQGYRQMLTNIEYCDFHKYNLVDEPTHAESLYSKFPSNTNLLFVDLEAIQTALKTCPIPGMLVNLKKMVYWNHRNEKKEEELARLESTMQNIADCFVSQTQDPFQSSHAEKMRSYITFNERRKTISTTKREYISGGSFMETPEGCFLDMQANARELLQDYCHFELPEPMVSLEEEIRTPSFLFSYHAALGPMYQVIGQKIRRGHLAQGSELRMSIAECDIEELDLFGSLHLEAEQVMGHVEEGYLRYSERVGRCVLKNVKVRNLGVDFNGSNIFWKPEIVRRECCRIYLEGCSELYAENVTLEGDFSLRIEDGFRVTLEERKGQLLVRKEKIEGPSWHWKYRFSEDKQVVLEK